jgi:glutathione S-transferase
MPTLYLHPFASYCQKVLIAFYELGVAFTPRLVEGDRTELEQLWPPGGIPVLQDGDLVLPESTSIIEYAAPALVDGLAARLWDRFGDQQLSTPMQKIVIDKLRPPGANDAYGVAEARASLDVAYGVLDKQLSQHPFAAGAAFSLADCAMFPPLFYLRAVHRWEQPHITRYYRELLARPAVARVVEEARPSRKNFPHPWPDDQDDV